MRLREVGLQLGFRTDPKFLLLLILKVSTYSVHYTPAIRKQIYTTNTVEGYHRQVHKVTKNTTCKLVSDITTISNKIWRMF